MVDRELADTAKVIAARERVLDVLGPLAAAPLDPVVVADMRRALDGVTDPDVQASLRAIAGRSQRPALRVIHGQAGRGAGAGDAAAHVQPSSPPEGTPGQPLTSELEEGSR